MQGQAVKIAHQRADRIQKTQALQRPDRTTRSLPGAPGIVEPKTLHGPEKPSEVERLESEDLTSTPSRNVRQQNLSKYKYNEIESAFYLQLN